MAIVVGFDVHRRQIMLDALDTETGEVRRGRIDATALAVDDVVTVSVEEILAAMRLLFERLKTVAEPSGASALAVVIAGRVQIPAGGRVGVTISAGGTSTPVGSPRCSARRYGLPNVKRET